MCICIYDIPEHSAAFFGDDGSTTIMPSFLRARWPPFLLYDPFWSIPPPPSFLYKPLLLYTATHRRLYSFFGVLMELTTPR